MMPFQGRPSVHRLIGERDIAMEDTKTDGRKVERKTGVGCAARGGGNRKKDSRIDRMRKEEEEERGGSRITGGS